MSIHYIYILRCPHTLEVRYVGRTQYPAHRKREHCHHAINKPVTKVQFWLISLRSEGVAPIFEIVASGRGGAAMERQWIQKYKADGANLLNVRLL